MGIKPPALSEDDRLIRPGRAIFATVGLRRVLAPGAIKITQDEFARAVKLEAELWATVYRFMSGEREVVSLPEYDHEEASRLLAASLDEPAIREDLAQFKGHPGGDDFIAAASQAAMFLRPKIPRRVRATWGSPRPVPPGRTELMRWRRVLETVGGPLWAVRQLLAGTLGRDHIEALAAVWPDVLDVVRKAAENARGDLLEEDVAWQPSRRVARQLVVLLGKDPAESPGLVKAMQAAFAQEAKEQAEQRAAVEKQDNRLETPVQRVAAR